MTVARLGGDPTGAAPWSADEARRAADEILADDRYREPARSLIERALDWVNRQISEIVASLFSGGASGLVAWVILGAAAAAIVWFALRVGRSVQADRRVAEAAVMVETTRTPREWRADAEALERSGRHNEAVRARYRALVADLVLRDVIPEVPGRTAGEYVRDVAQGAPAAAPAFGSATGVFELAWYGGAPTGAAECERFRSLDREVLAAIAARSRVAV